MRIRTLFLYLIGSREAILTIARDGRSILIALVFVLSAGFAREYDQEDLLRDPLYLVLPLFASWIAGSLLYLLALACGLRSAEVEQRTDRGYYLPFLSLFWMTAPLAWLYAVPYEEFLTAIDAAKANLITLGLVSLWRVLLMIRVLCVLLGYPFPRAAFMVAVFGTVVTCFGLCVTSLSLIGIMGGVSSLSPTEQFVHKVATWLGDASGFVLLIGIVGLLIFLNLGTMRPPADLKTEARTRFQFNGIWLLAGFSVVIWVGILPFTQPKQQLASHVEEIYYHHPDDALATMSQHAPKDFPPHWSPPPARSYPDGLSKMLNAIARDKPAPWVLEAYLQKATWLIQTADYADSPSALLEALENIPGGQKVIQEALQADSQYGRAFRELMDNREKVQIKK